MSGLRESGVQTGGPPALSNNDRQVFANTLDRAAFRALGSKVPGASPLAESWTLAENATSSVCGYPIMNMPLYQAVATAPGFCLGVRCNEDEITSIDFLEPQAERAPKTPLAKETVRQLRAYLKDPTHEFTLPLVVPVPISSAGYGSRSRQSPWQKPEAMARLPKVSAVPPVPLAGPVVRTPTHWLCPVIGSSLREAASAASPANGAGSCSTSSAGCCRRQTPLPRSRVGG